MKDLNLDTGRSTRGKGPAMINSEINPSKITDVKDKGKILRVSSKNFKQCTKEKELD